MGIQATGFIDVNNYVKNLISQDNNQSNEYLYFNYQP